MHGNDFRIGILTSNGSLQTKSGAFLLTRIPVQAGSPPESALLTIDPADVGKMALVRGDLSGYVLYSAEVVEVIPPMTSGLVETMVAKGNLSYQQILPLVNSELRGRKLHRLSYQQRAML